MQVALAYNGALVDGRITNGGIIQPIFLESLLKRVGDIFVELPNLKGNFYSYLSTGKWPDAQKDAMILSWYLQWYSIPPPHVVSSATEKVESRVPAGVSMLPLLCLVLPSTHLVGLIEIEKVHIAVKSEGLALQI
jgi:anaphase-promoting complex subunit 1